MSVLNLSLKPRLSFLVFVLSFGKNSPKLEKKKKKKNWNGKLDPTWGGFDAPKSA